MRQTIIPVFVFLLFSFVFFQMTGCRLIDGYSDDITLPAEQNFSMSLAGTVILPATTEDAASLRHNTSENLSPGVTVSGDLLLAGVEVWIDELPNLPHQFTDDQGKYLFRGIPAGNFHVVAAYRSGNQVLKVRSNPVEIAAASGSEIIVPDMTLKKASKVVTGVFRDDTGNFMPAGTVLVLWGEKFTVGANGTFTSPPLPDNVATAPLIIFDTPQTPAPAVLQPVAGLPQVQVQFVSSDQPTTVDLQVVEDLTKPQPVAATVSLSRNDQILTGSNIRVFPGDQVKLSVALINIDYTLPGLLFEWDASRGSFAPGPENAASVTWIVPEAAGLATVSVRVSAPERGFVKLFIPLLVEIQLPNQVYKVSFDARGGSAVAPASVFKGEKVTEPAPPARADFIFGGWYKELACINPWNFASETVFDNVKLYARWITNTVQTVQVLFDSAGGSPIAARNAVPGEKLVEPAFPVRQGYIFTGWYKDPAKTAKWDFAVETVVAGMTLFARWERVAYEVTFDAAGGSSVPAKTVVHGEKIVEPARPVFDGYDFVGWFKDAEGTTPWDFSSDTVFASLTLYARWVPVAAQMVEVLFDSVGGSTVSGQTLIKGEKLTEPAPPTREGHNFAGWYKEAACENPWNFSTEAVSGNLTLYARWIATTVQTVEVRFDAAGGSDVTAKIVIPGERIVEPAWPERVGYEFAGWYKEPECINAWNFATDTVTANVTLYACWKISSLVVLFDTAGGSFVASQTLNYGARVSEPVPPVRTNYDFSGWFKESAYVNAWLFSADIVSVNMTLYAKWTPRMAEVRFDSTGGSVVATQTIAYGEKLPEPTAPVREGHNFAGWYKESALVNPWNFAGDIVTGNLRLYARWIAITVQTVEVQFDSTGGNTLTAKVVVPGEKIVEPVVPVREGYVFGGWYKEAALTTTWNFTTDTVTENTTLYARWTQKTFDVLFDAAGGSAVASQTVVYDGKATEPAVPVREGYAFGCWYKEAALTTVWNFTTDTVTADTTLYASWAQKTFEVIFDAAGGSAVASQTVVYGGKASEPVIPVREGYTFGGWYKEAALTTVWNFTTDTVTADTTLYASWAQKTFEVIFDAAGGSAVASQTVVYGGKASEPAVPVREGYTFGGWYKEATLTTAWNFTTDTVTANTTLYAHWTRMFTLAYAAGANGSLSGSLSQTVASGSSGTAITAVPDTGYRFTGWSDGSILNPRTDSNVSAAISVTANFAAKDATVLADGRYAWSENSGWLDFSAAQASATARLGKAGYLAGMVWHENIGWIRLGAPGVTPPYANSSASNWGVNLDAAGKLSGYAWSENAGWINFSATSASVVLDQTTGLMTGSAWAENLGWVKFAGSLYSVKFKVD